MDFIQLAKDIVDGKRLTAKDNLKDFIDGDLESLMEGANYIREKLCGNKVDLCSIINGRGGACSENCKFCAQSAHHNTNADVHGFLSPEEILKDCKYHEGKGVHRYSIVTAGRTLEGKDLETACEAYKLMKDNCSIDLCASHGLVSQEGMNKLKEAGVTRYHANIETSRRNFPNVCTTHSFEDKLECIKRARNAGLTICSGGIIGMGETFEDRIDMALTLSELKVESIPINALIPIKGTCFENMEQLSEEEILRTVAIFRFINPTANIRLAAGRTLLENSGKKAFFAGANATITGDMLTTSGNNIDEDKVMLKEIGRDI